MKSPLSAVTWAKCGDHINIRRQLTKRLLQPRRYIRLRGPCGGLSNEVVKKAASGDVQMPVLRTTVNNEYTNLLQAASKTQRFLRHLLTRP